MAFGSIDLAKRIETAQARNQIFCAEAHRRLYRDSLHSVREIGGGGVAYYAGDDSPMTQVFGLGFAGTIGAEELPAVEEFFFNREVAVNIEVANLADMSLTGQLGERGYVVSEYSHVLGLNLSGFRNEVAQLLTVERSEITEADAAASAVAAGFLEQNLGEGEIPSSFHEIFTTFFHAEGSTAFAVKIEGEIAGAGSIFLDNGVAMLAGASVQPKFRNRGIQKALIIERLRFAHESGCDIAVVSTAPGTVSQRNMQAMGFEILYARTKFTKSAPKL